MIGTVPITEVTGRSSQGITRPFICDSFFLTYYVKGSYAGLNAMCSEWVANRLVQSFLPNAPLGVPPFAMGEVEEELIDRNSRPDIKDLGAGLVFASMKISEGQEMTWTTAQGWPERTMALLLLIDLWLQNEDRSLSAHGGNPNLLIQKIPALPDDDPEGALWKNEPRREMLWAYDFNLAFDPDFNRELFFGTHVFGSMLRQWPAGFREEMEPRMKTARDELDRIFAELPLEWLYVDGDDSLPVQLDLERVACTLELPFSEPETFWKLPCENEPSHL